MATSDAATAGRRWRRVERPARPPRSPPRAPREPLPQSHGRPAIDDADLGSDAAEVRQLGRRHQSRRTLGLTADDHAGPGGPDQRNVRPLGFYGGSAVEDVDVALPPEALALQHPQRRFGLPVDPADGSTGGLGQQRNIDRVVGEHRRDECLLTQGTAPVSLLEGHRNEQLAEPVPERHHAIGFLMASHLGKDLVIESLRMLGHQQETPSGQERPAPSSHRGAVQKQAPYLGASGVVVGQEQGFDLVHHVEVGGPVNPGRHLEAVERLALTDVGDRCGRAEQRAGLGILQHTEVVELAVDIVRPTERMPRLCHPLGEPFLVWPERRDSLDPVQVRGEQIDQRPHIRGSCRTQQMHGPSLAPPLRTPPPPLRTPNNQRTRPHWFPPCID